MRIAIICYNSLVAKGFNKNVQDIIYSNEYRALFPSTKIGGMHKGKRILEKNSYMFETSEGGYLISTGVGGALTSKTVDILILDDLYKSTQEAWSVAYREKVINFYNAVAETRLHNNSKQIILYTRWYHEDLAGILINKEKEIWDITKFEAIKETDDEPMDKREMGEALWGEMHSLEKLRRIERNDPHIFRSLFQQDPRPKEGLMYSSFKTYKELPVKGPIKCYVDTADSGADYLAGVIYIPHGNNRYILDIIYTKEDMNVTDRLLARKLKEWNVSECRIESNNGGRYFSTNVERILKNEIGHYSTYIHAFHQSKNKESRIFTNSSNIENFVYFPNGWEARYSEAYKSMKNYLRQGKNEHDDIQDALTGIVEDIIPSYAALKIERPIGL